MSLPFISGGVREDGGNCCRLQKSPPPSSDGGSAEDRSLEVVVCEVTVAHYRVVLGLPENVCSRLHSLGGHLPLAPQLRVCRVSEPTGGVATRD